MEIDRDTGTLFALTANYIVKVDPTSLAELSSYELPYSSRNFTMAFGSVWVTLDTDILVRAEIATFPADVVEIGSCNLDTGPIVASGGRIYIGSSDPEIRWVDPTDNSSDWDSALSSDAECPNAAVQGSLIWWPSTNRVFSTSGTSVVDTYAGFAGTSAVRWYDPFPSYGPGDEGKVLAIGEDGEKTWIEPVQPFNVVNINAQFGSGNPYYVDPDDGCIAVDTTVNPYGPLQDVYLALPPSPTLGEYHEIVDWNGGSGSFGINVAGNGNLISGMWDYWIRVGWGSLRVRYTGTTWSVL